jgi:hypothetical protein
MDTQRIQEHLQRVAAQTKARQDKQAAKQAERTKRQTEQAVAHDARVSAKILRIVTDRLQGKKAGLQHTVSNTTQIYKINTWTIGTFWGSDASHASPAIKRTLESTLKPLGFHVDAFTLKDVVTNNCEPPRWFADGSDGCVTFIWILMIGGIPLITRPAACLLDAIAPRIKIQVIITAPQASP